MRSRVFVLLWCSVLLSCDKGLEPPSDQPPSQSSAISGLITYKNWPSLDSLRDLRIVLFRTFPPGNIISEVLNGNAVVHPPLGDTALVPFYVDSLRFAFGLPPGVYEYVAVVQQYGPSVYNNWRPVGQYDLDTNLSVPTPVTVPAGDTLRDVAIAVDFIHRPPMPPQ
jgi:hypothetical protein